MAGRAAFEALARDPAFAALRQVSADLGADPLQVQGPGGNTSLKREGAMWVKASGALLAEARAREVFVPVRRDALIAAVRAGETPEAIDFVAKDVAAPPLRPSIETAVHAAFDDPVVLHTHCVATIAVAIREDAAEVVRGRLADLDPVVVPYVMPGVPLARALLGEAAPGRRVAILGNHGLVVTGETVEAARTLLATVSRRIAGGRPVPDEPPPPEPETLSTDSYRPAGHPSAHGVARDPALLALALRGPFYPDHVVFLGDAFAVAEEGEGVEAASRRFAGAAGKPPVLVFAPGVGAAIRRDAPAAADAMARCLGDVLARVEPGAPVSPIARPEVEALLGWDAEKHRQAMNAERSAP